MQQELLQHFVQNYPPHFKKLSTLDQSIGSFLKNQQGTAWSFEFSEPVESRCPIKRLSNWRLLFKAILLAHLEGMTLKHKQNLKKNWQDLSAQNLHKEFQIEQAYTFLCAHLLKIPFEILEKPKQQINGFTPLMSQDYFPYLSTPFFNWQAELGVLWAIIFKVTHDTAFFDAAMKVAQFLQVNLDGEHKPFKGALCAHHLNTYEDYVFKQGLLFHLVSLLSQDAKMAYLAKEHFSFLIKNSSSPLLSLEQGLWIKWNESQFKQQITPTAPQLPEKITLDQWPFRGERKEGKSFALSLLGVNCGLGSFKNQEVEIVSFSPQIDVLGEGAHYGFIGFNPLKPVLAETFRLDEDANSFHLEGVLGLQDTTNKDDYKSWHFSKDWIHAHIFHENDKTQLTLKPFHIQPDAHLVFYVSAPICLVDGEEKIRPHSLEQYVGSAQAITLKGATGEIKIKTSKTFEGIRVIPLEGGPSFWGANYLIAYHLNKKYSSFEWIIEMPGS